MKYRYGRGVTNNSKPRKNRLVPSVIVCFIVVLGYGATTALAPFLASQKLPSDAVANEVTNAKPSTSRSQLLLPVINSGTALSPGAVGEEPKSGGLIAVERGSKLGRSGRVYVEAPQYSLSLTPKRSTATSPLVRANQLKVGDELFLDYNGTRYAYKISKMYVVSKRPDKTNSFDLLLFAPAWLRDRGGLAIEAASVGTVIWKDDTASIKPHEDW